MKHFLILLILISAPFFDSSAQSAIQQEVMKKLQNMSQEDILKMQEAVLEMGECMGTIDQSQLKELEAEGNAISAKIDALCAAGKEDEAEEYAITEGQKMMAKPAIAELRNCSEAMASQFDYASMAKEFESKNISICQK